MIYCISTLEGERVHENARGIQVVSQSLDNSGKVFHTLWLHKMKNWYHICALDNDYMQKKNGKFKSTWECRRCTGP